MPISLHRSTFSFFLCCVPPCSQWWTETKQIRTKNSATMILSTHWGRHHNSAASIGQVLFESEVMVKRRTSNTTKGNISLMQVDKSRCSPVPSIKKHNVLTQAKESTGINDSLKHSNTTQHPRLYISITRTSMKSFFGSFCASYRAECSFKTGSALSLLHLLLFLH